MLDGLWPWLTVRAEAPCSEGDSTCAAHAGSLIQHSSRDSKASLSRADVRRGSLDGMLLSDRGLEESQRGASWTEEEALVVLAKLTSLVSTKYRPWIRDENKKDVRSKFECFADGPDANDTQHQTVPCSYWRNHFPDHGTVPTWPMMLRFGFHSCMKYKDGSGGCNGRLQLGGAFRRLYAPSKRYQCTGPGSESRRRGVAPKCHPREGSVENSPGHNANMALLADHLERIYTVPTYPEWSPPLNKSLKETGKSRADLWAFATLASAWVGLRQNNQACKDGTALYSRWPEVPCNITMPNLKFFSGRRDSAEPVPQPQCASSCVPTGRLFEPFPGNCKPGTAPCSYDEVCKLPECHDCEVCRPAFDGQHMPRPYESLLPEAFPGTTFNGQQVADYFEKNFDFSKREAVAIMGAHSFGVVHPDTSAFRYDWTHQQADQLNTVFFRIIAGMNSKHFERLGRPHKFPYPPTVVGGPNGSVPRTFFQMHKDGKDVAGGHFQVFHVYERCPFCTSDGVLLEGSSLAWVGLDRKNTTVAPCELQGGKSMSRMHCFRRDPCCDLCRKATRVTYLGENRTIRDRPVYDTEGLTAAEKDIFERARCIQNFSEHETLLVSDLALHRDIKVNELGTPLNCDSHHPFGFDSSCPRNMLADEGDKPMSAIVEEYAKDQNLWAEHFKEALEHMLRSGVSEGQLRENFHFDGISCAEPTHGAQYYVCSRMS